MREFGTASRKRCRYCKRSRPTYLLESHERQCAAEQNAKQAIRQAELVAELEALRGAK